ncbi:PREDICTED: protein SYM1-like [Ipomoea nil]|uniref:protein SYM1-like n=1 Tax=Ipomoea nil TaxID=35883 RepID=UPI0009019DAB|nr:PREDICTED: protein SYM1-like [Ipomoea nil]
MSLRNGFKARRSLYHLWKESSAVDSVGASKLLRTHHCHQQAKVYYRFPQSILKKTKEVELSVPSIISLPFSSRSSSTAAAAAKAGLVGWYLELLKTRPILTKSITCAVIYTAADFSSQILSGSSLEQYDLVRTLRMAGYGMVILGPSLHYWFNFISMAFPKRDLRSTLTKMAMGQTVFGPIMTAVFFSVNSALQGENGAEILARLKRDVIPTMKSGFMFWPMCDFITFRFIPVHLQPLVSNSFSYIWNVYLTYTASKEKVATA